MKKADLEHNLNCLHVYCRLRNLHVPQRPAVTIGKAYEALAHRILYSSGSRACRKNDTAAQQVGKEAL